MTQLTHPAQTLLEHLDGFSVQIDAARERADIVLHRPPYNIISMAQRDQLRLVFESLDENPAVRVIVLRAQGEHFSSGGDIKGFLEASPEHVSKLAWNIAAPARCSKPVIAAVEGPAAGAGFSLALACDLLVAAQSAKFVMAYSKVGLTPDGGGSWFLSQSLPRQLATEILLEGQPVTAARLHQAGVVNRISADGEALATALAWGDQLAAISPNAAMNIKALLRDAPSNTLQAHFEAEKRSFVDSLHHRDGLEGITAFLEKRKAVYK